MTKSIAQRIKHFLAAMLAVAGIGLVASPAQAACCVAPTGIVEAISSAERSIVAAINYSRDRIVFAVEAVGKTIEGWQKVASEQSAAETEMLQAAIAREGKIDRTHDAVAQTQLAASACAAAETSNLRNYIEQRAKERAKNFASGGGGLSGQPKLPPEADQSAKAKYEKTVRTPGESAAKTNELHKDYCNADDARTYADSACPNGASDMPDADVMAATIFDPVVYTPKQLSAAMVMLRNVQNPIKPHTLTKDEAKSTAGKAYHALKIQAMAMFSLGSKPLDDAVAARTKDTSVSTLADVVRETATHTPSAYKYYNANVGKYREGVSDLSLIEFEVTRRASNPDWYADVSGMVAESPAEKEAIFMQALELDIGFRQYQKLERIEALLGAMYMAQTRDQINGRLQMQYEAVQKAMAKK